MQKSIVFVGFFNSCFLCNHFFYLLLFFDYLKTRWDQCQLRNPIIHRRFIHFKTKNKKKTFFFLISLHLTYYFLHTKTNNLSFFFLVAKLDDMGKLLKRNLKSIEGQVILSFAFSFWHWDFSFVFFLVLIIPFAFVFFWHGARGFFLWTQAFVAGWNKWQISKCRCPYVGFFSWLVKLALVIF